VDKSADRPLLVETMRFRVGERIDAVESPIRVLFHRCLQGVDHRRIGGLPQKPKKRFVSHKLSPIACWRPISARQLRAPRKRTAGNVPLYIGPIERPDREKPGPDGRARVSLLDRRVEQIKNKDDGLD
jgi:hypothetical protein